MSLLNLNFDDVYDPETLPQGTEVQLRIAKAEDHESKAGNPSTHVIFEDPSNEKVDEIHHYFSTPTGDTEPKVANRMLASYRAFYKCFGIDNAPDLDIDTFMGLTGYCIVNEEETPEYGKKNTIKTFL